VTRALLATAGLLALAGCGGEPPERSLPPTSESSVVATVTSCGPTVAGTIRNATQQTLPYVQVTGDVLDAKGKKVGDWRWNATDLAPGETRTWSRAVPGAPTGATCRLDARNGL
jgi:hypothetical protein